MTPGGHWSVQGEVWVLNPFSSSLRASRLAVGMFLYEGTVGSYQLGGCLLQQ